MTDFSNDFDHTDPRYVADPYAVFEELRDHCPVAHTTRYGGAWIPVTHELVSEVARDTEHFTSRTVVMGTGRPDENALPAPIGVAPPITSDPPFHAMARRILQPAFSPKVVDSYEEYTRKLCVTLLEPFVTAESIDAAQDYAEHIPTLVIAKMLGFPEEDEALFRGFVAEILEGIDLPVEERMERFAPIEAYFRARIEEHIAEPQDDLTSYLLAAEIDGQPLLIEHVFGTMVLLIVAGIDTTWSAIGAAIWHLAQHPDQVEELRNQPELWDTAIEELLRAYAPVTMARLVKEDFDFRGCPMKQDDWVLLSFPAANRDPAMFEQADEVLLDRAVNRHAAFGLGIHRCLGSNLARMELRVALEEFIRHFGNFSLLDPDTVTWSKGQVRGPRRLELALERDTQD